MRTSAGSTGAYRAARSAVVAGAVAVLAAACTGQSSPAGTHSGTSTTPHSSTSPTTSASQGLARKYAAGYSAAHADPMYPGRGTADVDVLHYGLVLDWSRQTRTLTGVATILVRPTVSRPDLRLDFMPYTLDQVTVEGARAAATVTGQKLVVKAPVVAERVVTLVVRYHGTPHPVPMPSQRSDSEPLGLTVTADAELWTMQEPFGSFTWYPSNDEPSDKALYDIAVTAPAGWSAIASGTPTGRTGQTFSYQSTVPVASYLTTLAVGDYRSEQVTGPHGLPITYWFRPKAVETPYLLPVLRKSPAFIAWLESKFGPYPFPTAGVVLMPSRSAMETQQMVSLGERIFEDPKATAFVKPSQDVMNEVSYDLLHEYAHQWFGDTVTPTQWQDLWLNEGWATFVQYIYELPLLHASEADLATYFHTMDVETRKKLGPPGAPSAAHFAEGNVYVGGADMLMHLKRAMGDKAFYAMAKAWVQQHRSTNQSRASFVAFVNQQTGKDYSRLINSWLLSRTVPS